MPYTDNDDLLGIRPDILSFGTAEFGSQHDEGTRRINRNLKIWYESAAKDRVVDRDYLGIDLSSIPFDSDLLLNSVEQVKPAAIFLVLSLVYEYLSKNVPEGMDGFATKRDYYYSEYEKEWEAQLNSGFDYDWDSSGIIDNTESACTNYRTLRRQ